MSNTTAAKPVLAEAASSAKRTQEILTTSAMKNHLEGDRYGEQKSVSNITEQGTVPQSIQYAISPPNFDYFQPYHAAKHALASCLT